MLRLLIVGPLVCVAGLFGAVYFQNRLVYNNWGPQPTFVWESDIDVEAVSFKTADGETLRGYWCEGVVLPDFKLPQRPVVLFCHGNSCNIDQWRWVIDRWTWMIGADVLIFDYRGYGKSTGVPTEDGLYKDARAAYDWLVKEKHVDPSRILLVGQSLGGAVAIQLAGEVDHRLLILESTFTCMCEVVDNLFLGAPMGCFCHEVFPSLERLQHYKKPVFLSHGDRDTLVPYSHAERLNQTAGGYRVLWECKGMGHNDRRDHEMYTALIREFLQDHWK